MVIKPMLKKSAFLGAASLLVVASCGKKKSSGGSTVDSIEPNEDTIVTLETGALQLAGEVTILKGKDAGASLAMREVSFKLAGERTVRLRMTNEAFEEVERAGEIMCFLSQTKFWEQANAGAYQAQVDENKCSREQEGGGGQQSGASSSSGQTPKLVTVYVNATREENKPLIANLLLDEGDHGKYHVKVVVVEPPSDEAPAGVFDMRYTGHANGQIMGKGFIRTSRTSAGKFILETGMDESGDGRTGLGQGIAELEVLDENTVIGYVHSDSSGSEGSDRSYTSKGSARFDANFLNVDYAVSYTSPEGSNQEEIKGCYDLNKYKTAIFRYDLVDATGATVTRNSGFPIEYTQDGAVRYGWAGYHGMWLGENGTATSGMTVNKVDWTDGQKVSTPYTVFAAPGKLTKLTKSTTTLGALKGVDLQYHDGGTSYIVKWDGSTLSKTAKMVWSSDGPPTEEAASGTVTIPEWGANIWVPSLNANIQISNSMTLSDSLVLSYHSQKIVSGTAEAPTCSLVCFQNCPVMAPTAQNFQRSEGGQSGPMYSNLYHTTTVNWGQDYTVNQAQNIQTAMATYTWDSTTQNLKEGSTAFALPSDLPTSQDELSRLDMIFSGALVCSDVHAAISDKSIDPWRLSNELDTYYTFQSGAGSWNQFAGLKGSDGQFVTFDAPLQLSYTHTTANDWDGNTDSSIVGKSYRLEYAGPGQLQGIPWKMAQDIGHHMPLFSIRSGTQVGDYFIYAVDGEQRLAKAADQNSCASIPLDNLPALPSIDNLTEITHTDLGDVDSELRYVGGVAVE
ncbi:hypothetical protein [Oligoflexus tunisiensis]|uniref:hypothetical protein n=1 Tax=Oligoflexus tunisiensis TaxID=708132 RepID=UPI00114C9073|nr:hypothetical protein [Oligoflexus tunisiensis]